jgi:hypothetical protein
VAVGSLIPAQWKGQTRLLFADIARADDALMEAVAAIGEPLQRRLVSHRGLRQEQIIDTQRAWRQRVSAAFRLKLEFMPSPAKKPTALVIRDTRLHVGTRIRADWEKPERSIAVGRLVVSTLGGEFVTWGEPIALVSEHAVARWFERTPDRSREAMLRDFGALMEPSEAVGTTYGAWLADKTHSRDGNGEPRVIWSVRTYFDADASLAPYRRRRSQALA